MNNFQTAVTNVVKDMLELDLTTEIELFWSGEAKAMVYFRKEEGSDRVHGLMKELYTRLSCELGHPVRLDHTSPTDGKVIIFGAAAEARIFCRDTCCKQAALRAYVCFVGSSRTGTSARYKAIFRAAETLAGDSRPETILGALNWDEEPQLQLIAALRQACN